MSKKDTKHLKQQLRARLDALPAPSYEYALVMPDVRSLPASNDNSAMAIEPDMEDIEREYRFRTENPNFGRSHQ